jgi:hypothetical protein
MLLKNANWEIDRSRRQYPLRGAQTRQQRAARHARRAARARGQARRRGDVRLVARAVAHHQSTGLHAAHGRAEHAGRADDARHRRADAASGRPGGDRAGARDVCAAGDQRADAEQHDRARSAESDARSGLHADADHGADDWRRRSPLRHGRLWQAALHRSVRVLPVVLVVVVVVVVVVVCLAIVLTTLSPHYIVVECAAVAMRVTQHRARRSRCCSSHRPSSSHSLRATKLLLTRVLRTN